MKNSLFKKRLKEKLEAAKSGKLDEFENLPPNRYEGRVKSARLGGDKAKPWVMLNLEVVSGEQEGKTQGRFYHLSNEWSLGQLVGEFTMMGYDLDSVDTPEDLQPILDDMDQNNPSVLFSVRANKKNPDFPNTRIVSSDGVTDKEEQEEQEEKPITSDTPEDEDEDNKEEEPDFPDTPEDGNENEDEVNPGDKIKFLLDGKSTIGTVQSVDEDAQIVKVKKGKGVLEIKFAQYLGKA